MRKLSCVSYHSVIAFCRIAERLLPASSMVTWCPYAWPHQLNTVLATLFQTLWPGLGREEFLFHITFLLQPLLCMLLGVQLDPSRIFKRENEKLQYISMFQYIYMYVNVFWSAFISRTVKTKQAPGPHVGSPAGSSPVSHECRPSAFPCAPVTLQELWQL